MDCSVGTRPSYAWRSILHGRELLKQGLVTAVGDGMSSNVWSTNWIVDPLPRPLHYHLTNHINLALKVGDLFIEGTSSWNIPLVNITFAQEDVPKVLAIRP